MNEQASKQIKPQVSKTFTHEGNPTEVNRITHTVHIDKHVPESVQDQGQNKGK